MMEEGIYSFLNNNANISNTAEAVFPCIIYDCEERTTYPVVVYNLISATRADDLNNPVGVVHARIQIDSYGATPKQAADLANTIRKELDHYSGSMGNETCLSSILEDEQTFHHPPESGQEVGLWRKSQDYIITFRESA